MKSLYREEFPGFSMVPAVAVEVWYNEDDEGPDGGLITLSIRLDSTSTWYDLSETELIRKGIIVFDEAKTGVEKQP